LLYLHLAL